MCLSLVACGGGNDTPSINDNSGAQQSGGENSENNGTGSTESPYANHPFLQSLYGEWQLQDGEMGDNKYASIIINKDGTCLVDKKNGTWNISEDTNDIKLEIHIYIDGAYFAGAGLRGDGPSFYGIIARAKTVSGQWKKVQ